jgi:hypothetical protein
VLAKGNVESAAFEKLYDECQLQLKDTSDQSPEAVFISELAVTLNDKICSIAILQERYDDAIVRLKSAIKSASVRVFLLFDVVLRSKS